MKITFFLLLALVLSGCSGRPIEREMLMGMLKPAPALSEEPEIFKIPVEDSDEILEVSIAPAQWYRDNGEFPPYVAEVSQNPTDLLDLIQKRMNRLSMKLTKESTDDWQSIHNMIVEIEQLEQMIIEFNKLWAIADEKQSASVLYNGSALKDIKE